MSARIHQIKNCGENHTRRSSHSLVTSSERNSPRFLWKAVFDLHPRRFRANHEMHVSAPRRVGVECPEPEPQHVRSGAVTLVDRSAATTREEPVNAGTGFPAGQELFPGDDKELARFHSSRRPEA